MVNLGPNVYFQGQKLQTPDTATVELLRSNYLLIIL